MLVNLENSDGPNQTAPVVTVCCIVLIENNIRIKKTSYFIDKNNSPFNQFK